MEAWCSEEAVDTATAVQMLTGATVLESVEDKFPEVFAGAHREANECPFKMGGPGNLDLLYRLSEYLSATHIVETGVAYGWSSLAFLLSLKRRPGALLISIDKPYQNLNNDAYVGCVVPQSLRTQWRLIRCADRQGIPKALIRLPEVDLCHYDSAKSYEARLWSYPRLWKAVRKGGYFISDDVGDNVAFRDFCTSLSLRPVVVESNAKFVGVIAKT
jgi:hypothetical protein